MIFDAQGGGSGMAASSSTVRATASTRLHDLRLADRAHLDSMTSKTTADNQR